MQVLHGHIKRKISPPAPQIRHECQISSANSGLTASLTDARAMMESLGNAVAASAYAFKGDVRVAMTVSIGVVIAGAECDVDMLLKRADAAGEGLD